MVLVFQRSSPTVVRAQEDAMTDKPVLRVLETPHDRGDILVHHAGDPWAESELLGLPACPWRHFRRDTIYGKKQTMLLEPELLAALQAFTFEAVPMSNEGTFHS
jgi:hypothetical protein